MATPGPAREELWLELLVKFLAELRANVALDLASQIRRVRHAPMVCRRSIRVGQPVYASSARVDADAMTHPGSGRDG